MYDLPHEDGTGFCVPDRHPDFKYCIIQLEECPTTSSLHYQGYIELKKPYRMAGVKKMCNDLTMHLEPRRGTQQQAIDYCKKLDSAVGDFMEFGSLVTEQGKRSDLADMAEMVLAGATTMELVEAHPASYMRYHKSVAHLRQIKAVDKPDRSKVGDLEVALFYGRPGSGKTRQAFEFAETNKLTLWQLPICTNGTLWFDNYNGEDIALLDDFSGKLPLDQFLRLIDRYPIQVPVKGGHCWWCPRYIIITTNCLPSEWYDYSKRADSYDAVKRRIHQILNFNSDPPVHDSFDTI